MAPVIQRELLVQTLDRPMAPIFQARRAGIAPGSAAPPVWANAIRSLTVAEFLRNYRSYSHLAHGTRRGRAATLAEMSADRVLALFLKLNMNDPNNDPATHAELQRLAEELRRQAIEEAAEKNEAAEEAKEEAEAKRDPVAAAVKALLSLLGL